jgi:hypothetical protein
VTDQKALPTEQEVKDAIAYFRSTTNRHDLTDILTAWLEGAGVPAPSQTDKPTLAQKLSMKK